MAKKPTKADDILKQMYPDIMTSDDYEEKPEEKVTQPAADPRVAKLEAEIAALQGQLGNLDKSNRALMSQTTVEVPPQMPQIDYSQAPDPAVDPKGFMQFQEQATMALLRWKEEEINFNARQARSQAEKVESLWSDFSRDYKAYAGDTEKVELAAEKVVKRAQAKNQNLDKYMYGNSEGFMADVAKEYDRLFGKPKGLEVEDDDEPEDRSEGLFDGASAGHNPAPAVNKPPERYGQLSKDLMAWQQKTGFHR